MFKSVLRILVVACGVCALWAATAQAIVVNSSVWHMGEGASVISGLPQDLVNTDGAYNNMLTPHPGENGIGCTNTVMTATPAPGGSTAYLHMDGIWFGTGAWSYGGSAQTFPADNYGVEIWARATANTTSWSPVMTCSDAAGGYQIAQTWDGTSQHWGLQRDGVAWVTQIDSAPVALDTWYDLALVRAGGSTQFYVNGVAVGSPTVTNQGGDGYLNFGMQPRFGLPCFTGDLDEARVFTFASGGFSLGDLYINQVPEPSAIAILTTGLLSLIAYAWRKRR